MNQVWQFWHAQLNDDMINNIISVGEQYPIADAGLGFDGSTSNNNTRKSEIRWINPFGNSADRSI